MKYLFVPYELAVKLKEKGFNNKCFAKYLNNKDLVYPPISGTTITNQFINRSVTAPLYQQIVDWLREKHNIHILYFVCGSSIKVLGYKWFVQVGMENKCYETDLIKDYYEGMTEAIKEALKLI